MWLLYTNGALLWTISKVAVAFRRKMQQLFGCILITVFRNPWFRNTIIIFIIKQICWTWGHMDLTMHNIDVWWNMLTKFSTQIGNSFVKIINTNVNSKPCQRAEMELFPQVTVELIWLLFFIYFVFNFAPILDKSLSFIRFRRRCVNHTAAVLTNHCQHYTAFLFDVCCLKWPHSFFAAVCPQC